MHWQKKDPVRKATVGGDFCSHVVAVLLLLLLLLIIIVIFFSSHDVSHVPIDDPFVPLRLLLFLVERHLRLWLWLRLWLLVVLFAQQPGAVQHQPYIHVHVHSGTTVVAGDKKMRHVIMTIHEVRVRKMILLIIIIIIHSVV